jgi:hypothetical protein
LAVVAWRDAIWGLTEVTAVFDRMAGSGGPNGPGETLSGQQMHMVVQPTGVASALVVEIPALAGL